MAASTKKQEKLRDKQLKKLWKKSKKQFVSGDELLRYARMSNARVPIAEARARNLKTQANVQVQNVRKNQVNLLGTRQRGMNAAKAAYFLNVTAGRHAQFKGAAAIAQKAQNLREVQQEYAVAKQNRVQEYKLNKANTQATFAQQKAKTNANFRANIQQRTRQHAMNVQALQLAEQQKLAALTANARKNMQTLEQKRRIDELGEAERLQRAKRTAAERMQSILKAQKIAKIRDFLGLRSKLRQKAIDMGLDKQQLKTYVDRSKFEQALGKGELQHSTNITNYGIFQQKQALRKLRHTRWGKGLAGAVKKSERLMKRRRFAGAYRAMPSNMRQMAVILRRR